MKAVLHPVGSNEMFGGTVAGTSRADYAFALVRNSMLLPFRGGAAERPN
jgi:hypothetical protein